MSKFAMERGMPVTTDFNETVISFSVSIVNADITIDAIHTIYGGGLGYTGEKIGNNINYKIRRK